MRSDPSASEETGPATPTPARSPGEGGDCIGVFDSGIGGLSVLEDIRRELPAEHLVYVADARYAPYGDKPVEFIERRATAITRFLISNRAKAIVVACNTATAVAVDALRRTFELPIVAVEPALKPAASATRTGVVGVMATSQTLSSAKFARLRERYGHGVQVVVQACPGLVEHVEDGDLSGAAVTGLVEQYVRPLVVQGADTIVLGCTHYAFLTAAIRKAAGADISILSPAAAVAREVRRRLEKNHLLSPAESGGMDAFVTSGSADHLRLLLSRLWVGTVDVRELPQEYNEK
jgi:glutamate racemase